jgi:hypothetical protein
MDMLRCDANEVTWLCGASSQTIAAFLTLACQTVTS